MPTTASSELDDDHDHRSHASTLSADVSESESAITLSDSFNNSPHRYRDSSDIAPPPQITVPLECHMNVVQKRDTADLSGMFHVANFTAIFHNNIFGFHLIPRRVMKFRDI